MSKVDITPNYEQLKKTFLKFYQTLSDGAKYETACVVDTAPATYKEIYFLIRVKAQPQAHEFLRSLWNLEVIK